MFINENNMETTYNEIFLHNQILANIPTQREERKLSPSTVTSLILLRAAYQNKIEEYENICRKALEDIKKDGKYAGLDDRARANMEADRILAAKKAYDEWNAGDGERPECPALKDIEKAEATKSHSADFDKLMSELSAAYNAIREKQASVRTTIDVCRLSRTELTDIVTVVGTDGTIRINNFNREFDEPCMSFLAMVAKFFA